MDLSVVVCSLNRAASLSRTLVALEAQATPEGTRWELVVVDNGSTDGTARALDAFTASTTLTLVRLFVPERGLSRARNAGLRAVRGAIVAFTDDDVIPAPDWVSNLLRVFAETGADVLGGRSLPIWERPPPSWIRSRVFLHELAIQENENAAAVLDTAQSPNVWGVNMAFRREVFDRVGDFDSKRGVRDAKLFRGEDTDLVSRAIRAGFSARYDPRPVVFHCIAAERLRLGYFSRLNFERKQGMVLASAAAAAAPPKLGASISDAKRRASSNTRLVWSVLRGRRRFLESWLHACSTAGALWAHLGRRWSRARSRDEP